MTLKSADIRRALVALVFLVTGVLHAGQYFQDFSGSSVGDTNFTDGSQLVSTSPGTIAAVTDATYKELKLSATSSSGVISAFVLPDLDPGTPIYAFSAKWNAPIYSGFPNAADGYSFNFGQLRNVNLTGTNVESGYGIGLCFAVQNYSSPGFYLRFNGTNLASKTYTPLTQWGSFNPKRHLFEVDWNFVAGMNVRVDGQLIFTNVATTGFFPKAADCFVWAARTGGLQEDVRLDNIVVKTGGNLIPVSVTSYVGDVNTDATLNASKAFDGVLTTDWQTHAPTGFVAGALTASTPILAYGITSGTNAANDPQSWTLDGSSDAGATWSPTASGSTAFMNRQETRMFASSSGSSFGLYRINVTTNAGGAATDIGEVQFFGFGSFTAALPTIDSPSITPVSSNSVYVSVGVTAHSLSTYVDIQFGLTTNYDGHAYYPNIGTNGTFCVVTLNYLTPGAIYHLRTVAINALGTMTGPDVLFSPGSFSSQNVGAQPTGDNSVAWGDYDNDGRLDFATIGEDSSSKNYGLVYHNDGGGSFSVAPFGFSAAAGGQVQWVDFDRDGFLDLSVISETSPRLYKNMGGTNLTQIALLPTANSFSSVSWGDYDNDGYPDMLMAGAGVAAPKAFLYHNNGGTNFTSIFVPGLDGSMGGSAWGDYDNDGRLDFIIHGHECVKLFHNDGGGNFHQIAIPGLPSSGGIASIRGSVAWGDYDKDGYIDFVVTGYQYRNPVSQVWHNQGGTNFTVLTIPNLLGTDAGQASWGDFNNDGNLDFLIMGEWNDYTEPGQLFAGDGKGGFGRVLSSSFPSSAGFSIALAVGDCDNDGDLDFIRDDYYYFDLWKNGQITLASNPSTNIPPSAPTGLVATATGTQVSLRWNSATDNATPVAGLSYNYRIGTTPGGSDIVNAHSLSNGFRQIVGLGNAMQRTNAQVFHLAAGTYYWSVQAIDNSWAGSPFAPESSFVVPGSVPTLISQNLIRAGRTAALLNCTLDWGGLPTTVWLQSGLSSNYSQTNLVTLSAKGELFTTNTLLTNLLSQTTYHYRFVLSNALGVVNGTDQTFTTTNDTSIFDVSTANDPAVGSSMNFQATQEPWMATDDSLATKYVNYDQFNTGLTIYPSGTNIVRALALTSADNFPESDPASFILSGSFDGVSFVQIASNAVPAFVSRNSIQLFSFTNSVAYPIYKVVFPTVQNPSTAHFMQIAEVELLPFGDVTGAADTTIGTLPPGASLLTPIGALVDRRLDGQNKLVVQAMSNDMTVVIVSACGLTTPKGLELVGGNDDTLYPEREPTMVKLEGSTDGVSYTPITSYVPAVPTKDMQIQQVTFATNTTVYAQYRVTISKPATNNLMQIGEVRVMGIIVPSQPLAVTVAASSITPDRVTFNGTIYPHAADTTAWFEYGLTTNYGQSIALQSAGNGISSVPLTTRVEILQPNTTYHYRAVASNTFGTTYGADLTFTTLDTFNMMVTGDTIIASSTNSSGTQGVANVISGNAFDRYANSDITNTGFTVFPGVTNVPVQAIGLFCPSDAPERDPASFILSGSNDGTNFTVIASNAVPPFPARSSLQSISFPNTNLYSVYKLIFPTVQSPETATSMQVAEVQLLPFGDITTTNDLVVVALPPGASTSVAASTLVDRRFTSQFSASSVTGDVVFTLTPAVRSSIVKGLELVGGSLSGRGPSSMTLEGSTDGINFFTLSSAAVPPLTTRYQIQDFSVATNTTACTQYRVTFGKPSGTSLLIGEFRLFGISEAPVLSLTPMYGQPTLYFHLEWPTAPEGYILESASDLTAPVWQPFPVTPYTSGNIMSVTFEQSGAVQFFRLRKP